MADALPVLETIKTTRSLRRFRPDPIPWDDHVEWLTYGQYILSQGKLR